MGPIRGLFYSFMRKREDPGYQALLDREDFVGAVPLVLDAIRRDDPQAMLAFGLMLILGRGIEVDMIDGLSWLRQSAVRGYPPGQLMLGVYLCADIVGELRNVEEAAYWLHRAVKMGVPKAADSLSTLALKYPAIVGVHFSREELLAIVRQAHRVRLPH
ncbi:MAG: sel1 repeat family protein [Sulfuritalea sp.]|nr:sel1 repeat family protein [Sulfuritalea sp.]